MRSREDILKRVQEGEKKALHEAKTKKQAQWLAIQEKTPETAEFLKLFSASFGKPARLKIVVDNEIILEI